MELTTQKISSDNENTDNSIGIIADKDIQEEISKKDQEIADVN